MRKDGRLGAADILFCTMGVILYLPIRPRCEIQNMAAPYMETKQTWEPIARQITYCPYCNKKYPTAILLLQHLGIRHGKYTWPTCRFPLQPKNKTTKEIWEDIWQHDNNKTRYDKNKNRDSNTGERRQIQETNPTKRLKLTPNQPTDPPRKTRNKRTIRDSNSGQSTQKLPQQNVESQNKNPKRANRKNTLEDQCAYKLTPVQTQPDEQTRQPAEQAEPANHTPFGAMRLDFYDEDKARWERQRPNVITNKEERDPLAKEPHTSK